MHTVIGHSCTHIRIHAQSCIVRVRSILFLSSSSSLSVFNHTIILIGKFFPSMYSIEMIIINKNGSTLRKYWIMRIEMEINDVYLLRLIFDIHMPINTEAHDGSYCHQVFAVKQLGMDDVCSIHISKGGEAIKQMRRETSSCLHFLWLLLLLLLFSLF